MMGRTAALAVLALPVAACSLDNGTDAQEGRNKRLARDFYEDLWFTENTGNYADYLASEYVIHDIGGRDGFTEPAVTQKDIADRFHGFGRLTGRIDYQIAEGDMVATRWFISLDPTEEAQAAGMTKVDRVPIINVFRFNDKGKIVEIWNHRYDIDLPRPPGNPPPVAQMAG